MNTILGNSAANPLLPTALHRSSGGVLRRQGARPRPAGSQRWLRQLQIVLVTAVIGVLALTSCGKTATTGTGSPSSVLPAATGAPASTSSPATTAGNCPTTNTTSFAKSKFVLHVGLAAGTFHRYLYKPFRAGTFHKGATGRISGLIKAAATALFDEHEIRLAIADVKASPALCKVLIAPLAAVADKFAELKSKVTGGDTSSVDQVNNNLASISSTSAQGGAPITESTNQNAG